MEMEEESTPASSPENAQQHDTGFRLASPNRSTRSPRVHRHGRIATNGAQRLVTGLGWLSLGLGIAGLLATRNVVRSVGIKDRAQNRRVVRALGVRELVSGFGILTRRRRTEWAWARFAGDVMDIALLQKGLSSRRSRDTRGAIATAALLGVAALDGVAAYQLTRSGGREPSRGIHLFTSLTINRSPEEVYRFWRSLQNLPRFMTHLESVEVYGSESRWRAKIPGNLHLEWEAEITDDEPNYKISWQSLPGSNIENHGMVRFVTAPGGRGTEVHLVLTYEPQAGAVGSAFAKLFGAVPEQMIRADLRRLKQILETGDVARSDASVHAGPHPARPSGNRFESTHSTSQKDGE